jgi:hypothetical protein
MSQKSTVITQRCPWVAEMTGLSIIPSTIFGSKYLPNVSLIRSLRRSRSTMRLKAAESWPISSAVETLIERLRRPASISRVPSSNWRTGRVIPLETIRAKPNPIKAARAVTIAEITTVCR